MLVTANHVVQLRVVGLERAYRYTRTAALLLMVLLGLSGCSSLEQAIGRITPQAPLEQVEPQLAYEKALLLGRSEEYRDQQRANRWLQQAAEQEHVKAQYLLGMNRLLGRGGPKDPAQARLWLSRAAEAGHGSAQYFLAELFLNGRGGPAEMAWGVQWLERSASRGVPAAQLATGVAYASGLGGLTDTALAVEWLLRAQQQGEAQAEALLAKLQPRLSGSQWRALKAKAAKPLPPLRSPERGMVRFVQLALNQGGYDAGVADGVMGPKTRSAIVSFNRQQDRTGQVLDSKLIDRLRQQQRGQEKR